MPRADPLAAGIASAFLAGEWTPAGLLESAVQALDASPTWLPDLIDEVWSAYRRAPTDRPRELTAFVRLSWTLETARETATRTGRKLPEIKHLISEPTRTVRLVGTGRVLDSVADVARLLDLRIEELDWFADPRGYLRRAPAGRLHHYRARWVRTSTGGVRLLEAPLPTLTGLQRRILGEVLAGLPVHSAAHGYVAGRSVVTGARPHVGADVVIGLDLESFFGSITAGRVAGVFRWAGYPEPVAHVLAALLTHASPVAVLRQMPATADPDAAHRLRRRLAGPHLPQGAPTSPALSNLVGFRLDRRLHAYAERIGATYTRYADDLTFSGPADLRVRSRGLIAAIQQICREEGFTPNDAKTRVSGSEGRQLVTGIVVNRRSTVPRDDFDRLRAILHNCRTHGLSGQNRSAAPDFRAHLLGRVSWVAALDPARGQRLRAMFEAIDWDPAPG